MKRFGRFVRIDNDMTWPRPDIKEHNDSLEYILRYKNPTKEDLLVAASVIAAYKALIYSTQKHRNYVCKILKE